jgi:hypothetical protein
MMQPLQDSTEAGTGAYYWIDFRPAPIPRKRTPTEMDVRFCVQASSRS